MSMSIDEVEFHREIGRSHKGMSVLEFLDAVTGPVDRSSVRQASLDQALFLNGEVVSPSTTLRVGDIVELTVTPTSLIRDNREAIAILHEKADLVVASKPSGLAFDASRRGGSNTLDLLAEHLKQTEGSSQRPRPVHRLDKDTSGVVVAALGSAAEQKLLEAFRSSEAAVEYLALVRSAVKDEEGEISIPLRKKERSDAFLVPDPSRGTPCSTTYRLKERLRGYSILLATPRGGRSHQVRAHLAAIGHPIVCDALYKEDDRLLLSQLKLNYKHKRGRPEKPLLARPALHAWVFRMPEIEVTAPIPADLDVALQQLRRLRPPT